MCSWGEDSAEPSLSAPKHGYKYSWSCSLWKTHPAILSSRNLTRYFTPIIMDYLLATEKGLFSGTSDKAGARKQLAVVSANSSSLQHSVLLFPPLLSPEQRLSGRGRQARAAQPPQNRLFPHPHDLVRTASQALAAPLSLSGNTWRKLSCFPHSAESSKSFLISSLSACFLSSFKMRPCSVYSCQSFCWDSKHWVFERQIGTARADF